MCRSDAEAQARPGILTAVTRTRWIIAAVLSLMAIVFAWISYALFASPTVDDPGQADAIIMLDGGGRRLAKVTELVDQGVSDNVVLASKWVPPVWSASVCNTRPSPFPADVRILCFEPHPSSTRGEVRFVSDLADEYGWDRLVIVASTDQVTRARMLFERCWDGELAFVDTDHKQPWPVRAVYEWAAMAKALVNTGC